MLSLGESYLIDDEYDDGGSDSGSSGTFSFPDFLYFDDYVGRVSSLGSSVFVPTGVKSKCDFVRFSCSYQYESSPKVVDSSKHFGAQIPDFLSKFETQFYSYSHGLTYLNLFLPLWIHQKHDPARYNGIHK